MATITKPIALDESLHTTEQTPRNLADVLAQALQMLNTTISGLNFINCVVVQALPTTDISTTTIYLVPKNPSQTDNLYDEYINLTGTSAGWEKIGDTEIDLSGYYTSAEVDDLLADKADVGDIPTVNDGTLTIQQNGETKGTFTANQSGNSTVNIETPTADIQTAVDEFETYNGGLLSECKVTLVPVQSGSGDPSPDNVRPISGHTQVKVGDDGKNLFDKDNADIFTGYALNSQTGQVYSTTLWSVSNYIEIEPSTIYTLTTMPSGINSVAFYDSEKTYISGETSFVTKTTPSNAKYLRFDYKTEYSAIMQLELGSTATTYEPYNGYQVTVNLGGTYYSGTLDVVSGELTVDSAFIASYNGETLPSTWISDRDVYAVGTTPTTGAEVCYKLATPQSIQLSPTMVKALVGENHLFAPLEGQEITESKYKQMFTFDDVIAYIQSLS